MYYELFIWQTPKQLNAGAQRRKKQTDLSLRNRLNRLPTPPLVIRFNRFDDVDDEGSKYELNRTPDTLGDVYPTIRSSLVIKSTSDSRNRHSGINRASVGACSGSTASSCSRSLLIFCTSHVSLRCSLRFVSTSPPA